MCSILRPSRAPKAPMASPMTRPKYPRTPHLPWSPGRAEDDLVTTPSRALQGGEVVVTEKMDGENTTIHPDGVHARSVDSAHHPSRAWVKALAAQLGPDIPPGWRLCGENLFARHSLGYDALPSYFLLFSVWDARNHCLSWDDTREWAALLGLHLVRELYRGPWTEAGLRELCQSLDLGREEGLVVRTTAGFAYEEFDQHVAKWVRPGHVQTDQHWMQRAVIPNRLALIDPSGGAR